MTKSRFMFFILGMVYMGIAIGSMLSIFTIDNNVLLGLSVSSCLISIGELVSNIGSYYMCRNSFCYSLKYTSDYLNNCIESHVQPRTNVDVYNIKLGIDETLAGRKPSHPVEFDKKKIFSVLRTVSQGLFIFGIVGFVLIPFANREINTQTASRIITIIAFAFMCLNIGVNDCVQETVSAKAAFDNDKVLIVDDAFSGFLNDYYYHLQHYTAFHESSKRTLKDDVTETNSQEPNVNTDAKTDNSSKSLFERLQNTK